MEVDSILILPVCFFGFDIDSKGIYGFDIPTCSFILKNKMILLLHLQGSYM